MVIILPASLISALVSVANCIVFLSHHPIHLFSHLFMHKIVVIGTSRQASSNVASCGKDSVVLFLIQRLSFVTLMQSDASSPCAS